MTLEQQRLFAQLRQEIDKIRQKYIEIASSQGLDNSNGSLPEDTIKEAIRGDVWALLLEYEALRKVTRDGQIVGHQRLDKYEAIAANSIYLDYEVQRRKASVASRIFSSDNALNENPDAEEADNELSSTLRHNRSISDNGQETSNAYTAQVDAAK